MTYRISAYHQSSWRQPLKGILPLLQAQKWQGQICHLVGVTSGSTSTGHRVHQEGYLETDSESRASMVTARHVKHALGKSQAHHALAAVNAPLPNSASQIECMQWIELEKACLAKAGWRLMQVGNMPLLIPPLLGIFKEANRFKKPCLWSSVRLFVPGPSGMWSIHSEIVECFVLAGSSAYSPSSISWLICE